MHIICFVKNQNHGARLRCKIKENDLCLWFIEESPQFCALNQFQQIGLDGAVTTFGVISAALVVEFEFIELIGVRRRGVDRHLLIYKGCG